MTVSRFQHLFDLLEGDPVVIEEAVAQIDAWERESNGRFPRAMREFYSTALTSRAHGWTMSLPRLWWEFSNDDRPRPLAQLLGHPSADVPEKFGPTVPVISEHHGDWLMYAVLADDDPVMIIEEPAEVFVDLALTPVVDSLRASRTFSEMIWAWFAFFYRIEFTPVTFGDPMEDPPEDLRSPYDETETELEFTKTHDNGLWLRARHDGFALPIVDSLLEQFDEGPRTSRDRVVRYEFTMGSGNIAITADDVSEGATAAWWIHAENADELASIGAKLMGLEVLPALTADTEEAAAVLANLT